mmetsp:Transcript_514/g.1130  ORF Transcript_514/g.1130 Transcript_514/m.1130 type:complete len:215 (-) Transcript_514:483-1127(-)
MQVKRARCQTGEGCFFLQTPKSWHLETGSLLARFNSVRLSVHRLRKSSHANRGSPTSALLKCQVESVDQIVQDRSPFGDGRQVYDEQRVVVVRQELLLELFPLDGGEAPRQAHDLAHDGVVVHGLAALHLPEDGKEQPQARDEHLQRGVQAPEVRRDLRRAVGAARRDELGDLVDGDALRLRGLDVVVCAGKLQRVRAVDDMELALIERDREVL